MRNMKTDIGLPLPDKSEHLIDFLSRRRSNLVRDMHGPGPNETELETILTIAARVPDHRKLTPWRFIIFKDEARAIAGKHIAKRFAEDNPNAPPERQQFESERLLRAPIVIGVISSPVNCPRGTPDWEQILSAGAVCFNLCLAAQAHGYAAQWLTEWYASDEKLRPVFGLKAQEKIAGFIYIGQTNIPPVERARPNLTTMTQIWAGFMR